MKEFVRARARGDEAAMQRWWGELLTYEFPRLISATTLHGRKILSGTEIDDAISEAADRMARLVWKRHQKDTLDSFIAALVQVCKTSCLDVQRKAAKAGERRAGSLDEIPAEGDAPWVSKTYAELETERLEAEEKDQERRAKLADDRDFLDWALPQLPERPRQVFERLLAGLTPAEVMEELDMKRNAVDQNKKRAFEALRKLKEQYPS